MRWSTVLTALAGAGLVLTAAPATATAVDATPDVHVDHVALTASGGDVDVAVGNTTASVSADGKVVMWTALGDVTVPGAGRQTYVTDRRTGAVTMLTTTKDGVPSNGNHYGNVGATLAADGRTAAFFDEQATNLSPAGGSPLSQVFIRNLRNGRLSSARLPLVSATSGQVRPVVRGLQLSGDARYLTVSAGSTNWAASRWSGVLRYDTVAGTWVTLCGGDTPATSCGVADSSRDGRYALLGFGVDDTSYRSVVRDLTTGVDAEVPRTSGLGKQCLFSGDSTRLVCIVAGRSTSTVTTRSLPSAHVVGTSRLALWSRMMGVSADGSSLALTTMVQAGRGNPSATRVDVASGTTAPVAVLPSGAVAKRMPVAQGMSDTGQVLFTSLNTRLGGGSTDVPGHSLLLATLR